MTRRCFLHVGSPKTGTTYLQGVLWASKPELRRLGLTLPMRRADHFRLSVNLRDGIDPEVDPPSVEAVVDRMLEAVTRARGDVLISNESLAVATPAGIADLHERLAAVPGGLEVHVVLTARDWPRQLPAEWQQFVKTRHQGTFEEFLEAVRRTRADHSHRFWRGQDYPYIAARWAQGLPSGRVHVVTVPPPGSPSEILLARFCGVLGVDPAGIVPETPRVNPSLGYEQAELMRRINVALGSRLPKPRVGYNKVAKFWLAEQVLAPLPGTRLVLPTDQEEWWHRASAEMVAELGGAGYDVVGDLGDLIATPPPTGAKEHRLEASDTDLLELAVEGLAAALTQRDEDLREIRSLRQQVRRSVPEPATADEPPSSPASTGTQREARRVSALARPSLSRVRHRAAWPWRRRRP